MKANDGLRASKFEVTMTVEEMSNRERKSLRIAHAYRVALKPEPGVVFSKAKLKCDGCPARIMRYYNVLLVRAPLIKTDSLPEFERRNLLKCPCDVVHRVHIEAQDITVDSRVYSTASRPL